MNKYFQILRGIGFSDDDSKIYLCLLDRGVSSIADIVESTTLHRTQVYRQLPNLLERGFILVSSKGKRKFYKACSPEFIKDEYNRLFANNNNVIAELEEKYKVIEAKTSVVHGSGLKYIHGVYNDMINSLDHGDIFYRITSEKCVDKVNDYYIPKGYKEKRDRKNIERYIIMSDKNHSKKVPKLEREVKVIDQSLDMFDDDIIYTIYADKISLLDLNEESSIVIQNKKLAEFQKKVFMMLFKKL